MMSPTFGYGHARSVLQLGYIISLVDCASIVGEEEA